MKKSSAETEDWNSQTSNSCLPPFLHPYWDLHLSDLSQPYASELAQKKSFSLSGGLIFGPAYLDKIFMVSPETFQLLY